MPLTLARQHAGVFGNKRYRVYDVTFDSSYPTGGESLTASDVGLNVVEWTQGAPVARNTAGTSAVPWSYDHTNSKLFAYETGDVVSTVLDEVGSTESLDTYKVRIAFFGY